MNIAFLGDLPSVKIRSSICITVKFDGFFVIHKNYLPKVGFRRATGMIPFSQNLVTELRDLSLGLASA